MKIEKHILACIISATLICCEQVQQKTNLPEENIQLLEGANVISLRPEKPLVLPGELLPWNKVYIFPKIRGFVKEIKVDRGSSVKRGQVLVTLDAPEVLSEFDQAKGQLKAAEAEFNVTKEKAHASTLHYKRVHKASNTHGAVALNELDQAQARMRMDSASMHNAEGNLNAAQSHFRTKNELVKYLTIVAPFDGIIIERNISPGALTGVGEGNAKPILVLEDNTKLRLTLAIPENYTNAVQQKTSVKFSVGAVPGKEFSAAFGRSAESILDRNRVMMTEFDIDNVTRELKSGMYAQVKIPVSRSSATLFVPKTAIVRSSEKIFVIKESHNKAEWIAVQRGISIDTLVEVFGALAHGDRIAKVGSEEIREGMSLKLKK